MELAAGTSDLTCPYSTSCNAIQATCWHCSDDLSFKLKGSFMLMNEDLEEVAEPYHTGNSHQAGLLPIWLIRTDQVEAL